MYFRPSTSTERARDTEIHASHSSFTGSLPAFSITGRLATFSVLLTQYLVHVKCIHHVQSQCSSEFSFTVEGLFPVGTRSKSLMATGFVSDKAIYLAKMGGQISKQKTVMEERKILEELQDKEGIEFPGSDYHVTNYKEWMAALDLEKVRVKDVVWPGTHDSATNKIGLRYVSRPFAQCQSLSIYQQLVKGVRVFDIRVDKNRHVCHGILTSYKVDIVIDAIKKFLSETTSEFIILEIRTEYAHEDSPEFDKWLIEQFGEYLIPQDVHVFDKTLKELLPKRLFCIWKPQKAPAPSAGSPLWSSAYLKDNWTDTDLPHTKFQNNMKHLGEQHPVSSRKYFYRVENTATPQPNNPIVCVKPVTYRIRPYARLFISQAFKKDLGGHLQILSSDFIEDDFVDACVGVTTSRI